MVKTSNGYIVSASANCSGDPQQIESLLVQLDNNGDSLSAEQNVVPNGFVRSTIDGHYIFLGGNTAGLTYDTLLIAKTNEFGDTIWTTSLFFSECGNTGYDIINTTDGGYALTGIYKNGTNCTATNFNSFITKLNSSGQVQWTKYFGGPGDDELFVIRQLDDNGYALFGWTNSQGAGGADFYLIRTDEQGDSIWSKTYGGPEHDFGYGMDITSDGGFIMVGSYSDSSMAIKTNADGNIIWEKVLGSRCGSSYFKAITTLDKNLAFLIYQNPQSCSSSLIKTNLDGDVLWQKNWGGLFREVNQPTPGSYLMAGYVGDPPDIYLVKFDTTFQDSVIDFINQSVSSKVEIYPNPSYAEIHITFSSSAAIANQISMIDVFGREKNSLEDNWAKHVIISRDNLVSGVYFLNFRYADGNSFVKKIILN